MTKLEALEKQYADILSRLAEVLAKPKDAVMRDSAIKRFEIAFDLAWKFVKTFLEEQKGSRCASPKECFREAYRAKIIDYDEFWMSMTDWRNEAVHTYSEAFADKLYAELPAALARFRELQERLKTKR